MEAICSVLALVLLAIGAYLLTILSSSENRRKLAAKLLASAQAQDEIRRALLAIRAEEHREQERLEARFLGRRDDVILEIGKR